MASGWIEYYSAGCVTLADGLMTLTAPLCPICCGKTFGPGPRGRLTPNGAMPRCAGCQSLERHRISRIMFEKLGRENFAGWSAIQFSADPTVDPAWFGTFELSVYGVSGGLDIQAIDRPDCAYDYVGCSHVLEHVGNDRAALSELLRITAPDGLVYLAFPDPFREDVTRDWGFPKSEKYGHWRVYGRDVVQRFKAYIPLQPVLPIAVRIRLRVSGKECFCCPIKRAPSLDR